MGLYILIAIILGFTITFLSIIYGKNNKLFSDKSSKKSYVLLSELPDVLEHDYMQIDNI